MNSQNSTNDGKRGTLVSRRRVVLGTAAAVLVVVVGVVVLTVVNRDDASSGTKTDDGSAEPENTRPYTYHADLCERVDWSAVEDLGTLGSKVASETIPEAAYPFVECRRSFTGGDIDGSERKGSIDFQLRVAGDDEDPDDTFDQLGVRLLNGGEMDVTQDLVADEEFAKDLVNEWEIAEFQARNQSTEESEIWYQDVAIALGDANIAILIHSRYEVNPNPGSTERFAPQVFKALAALVSDVRNELERLFELRDLTIRYIGRENKN